MAYIIEQAGGKASSGVKPILDIQPTDIHQRAPIFIGSVENVDDYLRIRDECNKAEKKWRIPLHDSKPYNFQFYNFF